MQRICKLHSNESRYDQRWKIGLIDVMLAKWFTRLQFSTFKRIITKVPIKIVLDFSFKIKFNTFCKFNTIIFNERWNLVLFSIMLIIFILHSFENFLESISFINDFLLQHFDSLLLSIFFFFWYFSNCCWLFIFTSFYCSFILVGYFLNIFNALYFKTFFL